MMDDFETELEQLFKASDVNLSDEDFANRLMMRVHKNQRRSAIYRYATGLGLLVVAWFPVSFVGRSASGIWALPGEAILSAGSGQPIAQLPLLFLACMTAAGYLLLSVEY